MAFSNRDETIKKVSKGEIQILITTICYQEAMMKNQLN